MPWTEITQAKYRRDGLKCRCRGRRLSGGAAALGVERTLAWFNRNPRLGKDFEASIAIAESWIILAGVELLSRRLELINYRF
jgi:hypothetical protein